MEPNYCENVFCAVQSLTRDNSSKETVRNMMSWSGTGIPERFRPLMKLEAPDEAPKKWRTEFGIVGL